MSLNNNLEAFYQFTGNANDSSGNGNNGIVNGATLTTDKNSVNNQAYNFSGVNQYIDSTLVDITEVGCFSCWVNTSTTSDVAIAGAFDTTRQFLARYTDSTNSVSLLLRSGVSNILEGSVTADIADGNWHHIMWNWQLSSNTLECYIDGQLYSVSYAQQTTPNPFTLTRNIYFGARNNNLTPDLDYDGKIDEVRFYERILGEHEALELNYGYDTTADNVDTLNEDIEAFYQFTGNANDSSGNGNNGTVNGATLTSDKNAVSNQAYSFDGTDDYIDVPYQTVADRTSFSFHINSAATTAKYIFGEFNLSGGDDPFVQCSVDPTNNKIVFSGGLESANLTAECIAPDITDSNWHHVAITADFVANIVEIFVDGKNQAITYTSQAATAGPTLTNNLFIGARNLNGNPQLPIAATIDEFRIYNRVLSFQEVKMLNTGYDTTAGSVDTLTNDLEALYQYTGNTNDTSGNANDLTNFGATLTNDKNAVANQAYDFDGINDYMSRAALDLSPPMAFSFWVNPVSATSEAIFGEFTGSNGDTKNYLSFVSGKIGLDQFPPSGGVQSNATVSTGVWTHVVVSWDGSEISYYFDGVLDSTKAYSESYSGGAVTLTQIGSRNSSGSQVSHFDGDIDEFRIYTNTLSTNEVQALFSGYDAPTTEVDSGPINVPAGFGQINLDAQTANTDIDISVAAGFGQINLDAQAATSIEGLAVAAGFGTINLEAQNATSVQGLAVSAGVGTINLDAQTASFTETVTVNAGFGQINLEAQSATTDIELLVSAGFGQVNLEAQSALALTGVNVSAGTGTINLDAQSAQFIQGITSAAGFGTINLDGLPAQSSESGIEGVGPGEIAITVNPAVVNNTTKDKVERDSKVEIN